MKKIIASVLAIVMLVTGCSSQQQPKFEENAAELLVPAEVPEIDDNKDQQKPAEEPEHGIGYYVAVPVIVTVGFLGRLALERFGSHKH